MKNQELTLVFEHYSTNPESTWKLIATHLENNGLQENLYEVDDKSVPFIGIFEYLDRRSKSHFAIKGKRFSFYLSVVGGCAHDAIRIVGQGESNWNDWVQNLKKAGTFVQAFVVDTEYDFWQNAQDPIEYESYGKSYAHLPIVSNGLPFPLEKKIIDISKNPGRRVLRDGFIEAVASQMWLGDRFWDLTKTCKGALTKEGFEVEAMSGIMHINMGAPFTASTNNEIQNRLRLALFNK